MNIKELVQKEKEKRVKESSLLIKRPVSERSDHAILGYDSSDSSSMSESESSTKPTVRHLPSLDPSRNTISAELINYGGPKLVNNLPPGFKNQAETISDDFELLRELNREIEAAQDTDEIDTSVLFEGLEERRSVLSRLRAQVGSQPSMPSGAAPPKQPSAELVSDEGESSGDDLWRVRSFK